MRWLSLVLTLAGLSGFALSACGGDDSTTDTAATEDVNPATESIEASAVPDGSFAYEQDSIDTEAGTVTASFLNPAPIAHDFCVEDEGGDELGCSELIADGDSTTQEFELEAGEYTYFCSVAGHREGGMEGELSVK